MTTTPPGWYDDGHGAMRWWDGAYWTEHVATPEADESVEQQTAVTVPIYPGAMATAATVPLYPGAHGTAETVPIQPTGDRAAYPGAYYGGNDSRYPGDHLPVYPTDGGAFIAATEPRKSRLWIVWMVLGVIVLGIVIALAVAIPVLFLGLTSASSSGGSPGGAVAEQPAGATPSNADQQAAVDAVKLYDSAYQNGDCGAYLQSTTEDFRTRIEVPDCAAFTAEASDFDSIFDDYVTTVTSVSQNGDSISVFTTETYTSPYDEQGNTTDEPQSYKTTYEYVVIPADGRWAIDESYTTEQ